MLVVDASLCADVAEGFMWFQRRSGCFLSRSLLKSFPTAPTLPCEPHVFSSLSSFLLFFLRNSVCALWLTFKNVCLWFKPGISQCCRIFSHWMPESHQESQSLVLYWYQCRVNQSILPGLLFMSQTISYQWERASNLAQGKVVKVGHRRESREPSISQKCLGEGLGKEWLREFQKYVHLILVYIYRSCSVTTEQQNILHVIIFSRWLVFSNVVNFEKQFQVEKVTLSDLRCLSIQTLAVIHHLSSSSYNCIPKSILLKMQLCVSLFCWKNLLPGNSLM